MTRRSIRSKFTILIFFIFPFSMILTGIYFYFVISSMLSDNVNKDLSQLIQQVNSKVESQFTMVDNASLFIFSNPIIKENLSGIDSSEDLYTANQKKLDIENQLGHSLFYNYAWDSKLFKSVYIFKDENTYYYLNKYFELKLFENHLDIFRRFMAVNKDTEIFHSSLADQTIYLVRKIKDLNKKDSYGTIIMGMDENILEKSYTDILSYLNAKIYIYDSSGIIISCKSKEMLGKSIDSELLNFKDSERIQEVFTGGKSYYIASKKLDTFGLVSVILIPKNELLAKFSKSINIYFYIILAAIVISIILSFLLSSRFMKPINDLISNLNKFKGGDFSVKMPEYKDFELNELSFVFNKMTDEIHYLFKQVYEKQLLLKDSELKSLQSQVNPHFLFNVLDTISWEARAANNDKIYRMIASLGHLLRANINNTGERLLIREELSYVKFYLYLQEMRFGEKLSTHIAISDESIYDFYIPKFSIQTVVENAVVHGLENKIGKRNLTIGGIKKADSIVFKVMDDGIGFDVKYMDFDTFRETGYSKDGHSSFGLYNVNRRIKLLYGDEYGLSIDSRIGQGTEVIIHIPLDGGKEENA